jgi:hypothetical protein
MAVDFIKHDHSKKKIQYSAVNKQFTLHKEGLFYKCYNEDAMVFVQKVKDYKLISKFVKNVGAKVISLGFPISSVEKGNMSLEFISEKIGAIKFEVNVDNVVFILDNANVKSNYTIWAEALKQ